MLITLEINIRPVDEKHVFDDEGPEKERLEQVMMAAADSAAREAVELLGKEFNSPHVVDVTGTLIEEA